MMNLTDHHAKYFAHELTKRSASDSVEKLAGVLADAQVDLNPHQIEAALFAFRNPFSRGAILADEVGLGKTIEAGLLLAQHWAERKRKLLVIVPANLRKQWSQELLDKFFLPSAIMESRSFNEAIKKGNLNPFVQNSIVLCSYQFARAKEMYVRQVEWNLVVIDEAHRLRNVYKPSNRIANAIKQAVSAFPKVLLTATPLQNSLLELYGLVSIIDDYAFGDLKSFRSRFARLTDQSDFAELKERLKPICKRTLRRQVLEYVPYTDRHALVQEFEPSPDEQQLYNLVSDYLQQPTLYALPAGQRQLMTLILRKLLASSTYAISGTLDGLAHKLEDAAKAAEIVEEPPQELSEDIEDFDELADEWDADDGEAPPDKPVLTPEQIAQLKEELERLREFKRLAASIVKNSKGEVLLTALRKGFTAAARAQEKQGGTIQQKAIIFTESRRTQDYLFRVLEQTEFKGKVMIFNGVNNDPGSKAIYKNWLAKHVNTDRVSGSPTADMRAALVEHFRDDASILIATEAAAEGINLQFCNLVVNYDLPWNPQRIEQRIGRCHRYGQKFDVVVVNFLNKRNAADQRVYQLLDEKFRLFSGVFGASDEVLGAVESGVDFEKRIAAIYQQCRTPEQIQFEFDQLQKELESDIVEGQQDAREKLLNNFDQEVVEKVRVQSHNALDKFNRQLWLMTRHVLADHARFQDSDYSFTLNDNPFSGEAFSVAEEKTDYTHLPMPDVLAYLQNETELTRSTLARVLRESGRLSDFLVNPQRFMDHATAILKYELHRLLVDGIKYDRIQGTGAEAEWEMVLFKNEELVNVLTALQVNKSIYDYISYDSEIEREFAQKLDQRADIRLFVKLPDWFKVDTPVGSYNPDWAIVKHEDETIYLVRETKGTKDFMKLRTSEADKVRCGQRHFDALGVSFAVAVSADDV